MVGDWVGVVYCVFEYDVGIVIFELDFGDYLEEVVCFDFFFGDVGIFDYFVIFFCYGDFGKGYVIDVFYVMW